VDRRGVAKRHTCIVRTTSLALVLALVFFRSICLVFWTGRIVLKKLLFQF